MNITRNPVVYIETDDGEEITIVKRDIMAETDVDELTELLDEIREYSDDIFVMFKAFADLGQSSHAMATKLGCYKQAEKWVMKRLKAIGAPAQGDETDRERAQADHITKLLNVNAELRTRLAQYEQVTT